VVPRSERPAMSTTAFAILVIVVIVAGAAIGIYYPRSPQKATAPSTTSTSSTPSASSTASTSSTTSTASSSASSRTTAAPPAPAPPLFNFTLTVGPGSILMSPGATAIYPQINVIPSPSTLQGQAVLNEGIGDELVVLNATLPSGISLRFFGSNLTDVIYQEVGAGSPQSVELQLVTAPGIALGNYPVNITASSGTLSVNYSFTVQVVQYLVIAQYGQFSPVNLNVTAGSTVHWINVDPDPAADYNVIFDSLGVQSPPLNPCPACDAFSYTFTTPGVYPYYDTAGAEVGMKGTITVTG
jgi:plastocyanin